MPSQEINVKVVGAGGIAGHLLPLLCLYLSSRPERAFITVYDGDNFEIKNRERQEFARQGNKAEVKVDMLQKRFPSEDFANLRCEAKPFYITEDNVFVAAREGDFVFLAVDNHATRKLVSAHCQTVQNITLFSGGNDFWDGDVQVFRRRDGENLDCPIETLHPSIQNPKDKNPAEMSCEELAAAGAPQMVCTNNAIAAFMFCSFCLLLEKGDVPFNEVFVDLEKGAVASYKRPPSVS